MATTCTVCKRSYTEELCPYCTVTDVKVSELTDKLHLQHGGDGTELPTAFLVDLVSNRKIPITTPRCKVGRDDLNDIVISGDQSISRFHFVITKDNDQYMVQDSKSRHGTFLNGNQIAGPIPINDGDVLKVGVSLFWFVIENQAVGSGADQFAPVDIETIDAQEMKVAAGEKTTSYAPTRETDISSMTSLKEVLAQAKAKESSFNEAEMSKTIAPKDQQKANDKASGKSDEKQEKSEEKEEKSADKEADKSSDKSSDKSDSKESKEPKDSKEAKDQKDSKSDSDDKEPKSKKEEEKETAKKEDSSEKKEDGMQITASMLMEALEHESLSEVSKLDDEPKGKDKPEEAESKEKEKGKKSKKENDEPSEKDLQGLFSGDNGNLDKTSDQKEAADSNNKDQESSTSDKITDSQASADKAPEEKSKDEPKGNNEDFSPDASDKKESDSETVSKSTLDKMADTVQEMSNSDNSESKDEEPSEQEEKSEPEKQTKSKLEEAELIANQLFEQEIVEKTKNGAWSGNTMQDTKVPDWCSKYFASELNLLVKDLDNLNEQVRNAQNKIKEVENRLAATKSLRNTLLTSTGEDLVEACGKVLARLGWRVKIVEDDKQELRLESDDKVSICRIIWTPGLPERTHLGQLSIAQTRFWCEQGAEPKGILIAAQAEDKPPPKITDNDYNGELADYASKKNVLMLTTLQLLAMYKEVALNEGSAEALRSSIHTSNGWLKGYSLDPSDEDEKEPGKLASASI